MSTDTHARKAKTPLSKIDLAAFDAACKQVEADESEAYQRMVYLLEHVASIKGPLPNQTKLAEFADISGAMVSKVLGNPKYAKSFLVHKHANCNTVELAQNPTGGHE